MPLNSDHYSLITLPPAPAELLASYDRCPVDEYMGNGTRYKRFSQYRLHYEAGTGWNLELLEHRAYTAYKKFNPVGGGKRREYLPLEADFGEMIKAAADGFPLDRSEDWQINVHQNRTKATAEKPGPLTPEGIHHDGHEFVMIGVLRRNNVAGALTRLWTDGAEQPFWTGTLEEGEAVLLDDRAIAHDVTDVLSADGRPAHRDIVIVAFSRWREKWYGEDHDRAVLTGTADEAAGGTLDGAELADAMGPST